MNSKSIAVIVAVISALVGALVSTAVRKTDDAKPVAVVANVPAPETVEVTFHMDAPQDGIAITHAGDKPLPLYPTGIGTLSDPSISQGFVLLTKLRDASGAVIGFTSEQEVVSPESNLATGTLMTQSSWTLTIPGRGTIFLFEIENQSEFLQKAGVPALTAGKEWNEPWTFVTTAGPHESGQGLVVGGTGEFEGITGTFAEITHLERFTPKGELFGKIELKLAYQKPVGGASGGQK